MNFWSILCLCHFRSLLGAIISLLAFSVGESNRGLIISLTRIHIITSHVSCTSTKTTIFMEYSMKHSN